ncbi:MAG: hypothetical protein WKF97_20400 [Chitinophagaceae bacterium]
MSLLLKAKVLTIFYYGFKELVVNMCKRHKKADEGLKRVNTENNKYAALAEWNNQCSYRKEI